jgi:glycosyltransferase involved in cell wall biosynthesis
MTSTPGGRKPRLLLLITEDWYFWSHRLDLARAARDAGWEVMVATRVHHHGKLIEEEGFKLLPIRLARNSRRPWHELVTIYELIKLYRRERPDVVQHVALKPILYGGVAARVAAIPAVINAFAGLGYTFLGGNRRKRLLRRIVSSALRWALVPPQSRVVVQNEGDAAELLNSGIVQEARRVRIIRGVGVDTEKFMPPVAENAEAVVVLAGRMLWDKGIREFIDAAQMLRTADISARCVLVGMVDRDNPAAISQAQLQAWQQDGLIEWWGHRDDMPTILASAQIVVLPSYREGLPKVLLEAAACGRPLVATDVPGCREVVKDGVNGFLVPSHDATSLSHAIGRLLKDPPLRHRMGVCSRHLVVSEFPVGKITQEMLQLYAEFSADQVGQWN